jgi:hypothetical protein
VQARRCAPAGVRGSAGGGRAQAQSSPSPPLPLDVVHVGRGTAPPRPTSHRTGARTRQKWPCCDCPSSVEGPAHTPASRRRVAPLRGTTLRVTHSAAYRAPVPRVIRWIGGGGEVVEPPVRAAPGRPPPGRSSPGRWPSSALSWDRWACAVMARWSTVSPPRAWSRGDGAHCGVGEVCGAVGPDAGIRLEPSAGFPGIRSRTGGKRARACGGALR